MSRQDEEDRIINHIDNYEKDKAVKVFDWIKAAKLIKEYHIRNASVGFDNSVEKTFTILKNGKPVKNNDDVLIPVFEEEAYPVLIDDDRGEIVNCFVVIQGSDNIDLFKSGKKMISLRWPKEALDIVTRPFYRKDIQETKYFQLLLTNPLLFFWPLLG
jgi:hypothetical protein